MPENIITMVDITSYYNVNTSTPFGVTDGVASSGSASSTIVATNGLTTTANNVLLLAAYTVRRTTSSNPITPANGWTEREDRDGGSNGLQTETSNVAGVLCSTTSVLRSG